MKMLNDIVEGAVDMSVSDEQTPENWGFKELNDLLLPIIPLKPIELTDEISKMSKDEFKHMLKELATKFYESKEAEFPDAEQVRGRDFQVCRSPEGDRQQVDVPYRRYGSAP